MNKKILYVSFCLILSIVFTQTSTAIINSSIKSDNSPPNPPLIKVPDTITVGKFFLVEATIIDPDGDNIYIRFNTLTVPGLPNFWFGPIPSGIIYKFYVKYNGPTGVYNLGVQAKDIYDAESGWINVQFNITKVKANNNVLKILDYPNIFLIIQKILNRYD